MGTGEGGGGWGPERWEGGWPCDGDEGQTEGGKETESRALQQIEGRNEMGEEPMRTPKDQCWPGGPGLGGEVV